MKLKITPLDDRVLVKVIIKAETKTQSGLIIPESAQKKFKMAEVAEVGNNLPFDLKVGQRIIYDQYSGLPLELNDEDHLLMKANDILAIVEELSE